jgi:hypothetical protein
MKFVALFSLKQGVDEAKLIQAAQKRAEYQFPEGLTLIAEYWTAEDSPAVISVFEADDAAPLLENSLPWTDYFETTEVLPVVTAEEGLERFTGGS